MNASKAKQKDKVTNKNNSKKISALSKKKAATVSKEMHAKNLPDDAKKIPSSPTPPPTKVRRKRTSKTPPFIVMTVSSPEKLDDAKNDCSLTHKRLIKGTVLSSKVDAEVETLMQIIDAVKSPKKRLSRSITKSEDPQSLIEFSKVTRASEKDDDLEQKYVNAKTEASTPKKLARVLRSNRNQKKGTASHDSKTSISPQKGVLASKKVSASKENSSSQQKVQTRKDSKSATSVLNDSHNTIDSKDTSTCEIDAVETIIIPQSSGSETIPLSAKLELPAKRATRASSSDLKVTSLTGTHQLAKKFLDSTRASLSDLKVTSSPCLSPLGRITRATSSAEVATIPTAGANKESATLIRSSGTIELSSQLDNKIRRSGLHSLSLSAKPKRKRTRLTPPTI